MASPEEIARPLIDYLQQRLAENKRPVYVALDGRSGAGKSTLAAAVAEALGQEIVTVIEGDQFYGGGSSATWDAKSTAEKVDGVIDWRRQRELIIALKQDGVAEWHTFDWESDDWDADAIPLSAEKICCTETPVMLLEGAYSARPELAVLFDLRLLLHVPKEVRRAQLLAREGDEYRSDWEARWSAAEDYYFGELVPADRFDMVLG
ncbi:MAG: uridine kinase [Anaerolineae bacterium]